jgi:hypothetical protein
VAAVVIEAPAAARRREHLQQRDGEGRPQRPIALAHLLLMAGNNIGGQASGRGRQHGGRGQLEHRRAAPAAARSLDRLGREAVQRLFGDGHYARHDLIGAGGRFFNHRLGAFEHRLGHAQGQARHLQ